MGFTKLDDGIIYSSVMGEDDSVFRVWIILLASCKSTGISPLSPIFIKNITGKSLDEVNRCLKILSEPDINSRSKNDEGRRIRSVDGGFEVINYLKYRDFTYSDNPEAIKKRKQRARDISGHVPDISGHSASASVSASVSASASERKEVKEKNIIPPPLALVQAFCKQRGKGIDAQSFIDHYEARGWEFKRGQRMKDWQAAVRTWEKNSFNKPKSEQIPYDDEKRIKEIVEGL